VAPTSCSATTSPQANDQLTRSSRRHRQATCSRGRPPGRRTARSCVRHYRDSAFQPDHHYTAFRVTTCDPPPRPTTRRRRSGRRGRRRRSRRRRGPPNVRPPLARRSDRHVLRRGTERPPPSTASPSVTTTDRQATTCSTCRHDRHRRCRAQYLPDRVHDPVRDPQGQISAVNPAAGSGHCRRHRYITRQSSDTKSSQVTHLSCSGSASATTGGNVSDQGWGVGTGQRRSWWSPGRLHRAALGLGETPPRPRRRFDRLVSDVSPNTVAPS
jgi:hypothetical protein